jgi:uncharacterized membrane protein YgcG
MSDQRRRFHPTELDLDRDAESAELLATARDLEAYAATGSTSPSVGFEDRVMAAIAGEPMPRPSGGGFVATVRDAWAIAFGQGRPIALRAQAFAMLLALGLAVGSVGTVAVVGAARLLGQPATPPPTVPSPSAVPSPSVVPSPSPSVSPTPSPTIVASPSASPDQSAEPSGTDDHGGGGGSGSGSERGSGSGSGSDDSGGSGGSGGKGTDDSDGSSGKRSGSASTHDRRAATALEPVA